MRLRFRLLSFLVAILTASVLIGLSVCEVKRTPQEMSLKDDFTVGSSDAFYLTHGWPFISHFTCVVPLGFGSNEATSVAKSVAPAHTPPHDTYITQLHSLSYRYSHNWHLAWNILIGLALTIAALVACEFLARRWGSHF